MSLIIKIFIQGSDGFDLIDEMWLQEYLLLWTGRNVSPSLRNLFFSRNYLNRYWIPNWSRYCALIPVSMLRCFVCRRQRYFWLCLKRTTPSVLLFLWFCSSSTGRYLWWRMRTEGSRISVLFSIGMRAEHTKHWECGDDVLCIPFQKSKYCIRELYSLLRHRVAQIGNNCTLKKELAWIFIFLNVDTINNRRVGKFINRKQGEHMRIENLLIRQANNNKEGVNFIYTTSIRLKLLKMA